MGMHGVLVRVSDRQVRAIVPEPPPLAPLGHLLYSARMDDIALWQQFTGARLPASEWTHRTHLRVAWLFLREHPLDEAHLLMRVGIIRLNAFHGLTETPSRGYHETLTRTWLALVHAAMRTSTSSDSSAFFDERAESLGKEAPLRHYSRELVFSIEARARFMEPDLAPLP